MSTSLQKDEIVDEVIRNVIESIQEKEKYR